MTEKSVEIGPIVAASMIVIGMATVIWAVATNPNRSPPTAPELEFNTSTTTPSLPEETGGISESEWEQTLIDVEKVRTDGVVTDVNAATQVATVAADKWNELSEDRRREVGRHLAVYCGRVSESEQYRVKIVDQNGLELASYERD